MDANEIRIAPAIILRPRMQVVTSGAKADKIVPKTETMRETQVVNTVASVEITVVTMGTAAATTATTARIMKPKPPMIPDASIITARTIPPTAVRAMVPSLSRTRQATRSVPAIVVATVEIALAMPVKTETNDFPTNVIAVKHPRTTPNAVEKTRAIAAMVNPTVPMILLPWKKNLQKN